MLRLGSLLAVVTLAAAEIVAQPASAVPKTVPALQNWTAGRGSYAFTATTRVVADASLTATARTFATDLQALTGVRVAVVPGIPVAGDIELRPKAARLEEYFLDIGEKITIEGTDRGVFNGTRTVLQLLRQSRTIPAGTARDWPVYPERGLLLDAGRKYFSVPWLRERIRELAYLKLNVLHLHLSDNLGFRLESRTHPEIVSARHYTKREIRDLVTYAAAYHVEIVPELDFPGHMDAILAAHPELKLVDKRGKVSDGFIDLSKPAAYDLMRDLITEYLPLFPGRYWHIGADEYVTNYADYPQLDGRVAYYRYINWADGLVRAAGKTARMWNDGIKPGATINPDIIVDHWSAGALLPWFGDAYTPQQLVDAGHRVSNNAFTPLYYMLGVRGSLLTSPTAAMYDTWEPNTFVGGAHLVDPSQNLGAKVDVWCDEPDAQTEGQIATGIADRLRVLSQQTWGSPKPAAVFLSYRPIIRAVGDAPATEPAPLK
jgi:hexosaminidase